MATNARVALRVVAEVLVIVFFALLGLIGYEILGVLAEDHLVSLPEVPVAWVQSVVPISAVLIVLAEILAIPLAIAQSRAGAAHASGEASH